jgi:hypothetical protein
VHYSYRRQSAYTPVIVIGGEALTSIIKLDERKKRR